MSYFVRAFTSTVGISPYSWFIGQRVLRAMILLSHSRMPIAEIALECGFVDQSHFTNTFVRRAGKTPRQWRQQATRAQPTTAPAPADSALAASLLADDARRGESIQSAARSSAIRAVQSSCTRRPSSSTRSANQSSSSSVIR
jgi:AraC-like DNA-binding protein